MQESKVEQWQLQQRQGLPLDLKEQLSIRRIKEWYEGNDGLVYVAFSGGKDSTCILHLVRNIYPDVPAVFVDTGLEYPEIREFVKEIENVVWIKPEMNFKEVISRYGYPVVSKKVARFLRDLQSKSRKNAAVRNLRLTGYNRKGEYCPSYKLPEKWKFLIAAPFNISEKCCDIMKKNPMKKYYRRTKRVPFIGIKASDSFMRERQYLQHGCNLFGSKESPSSMPIAFWKDEDVWNYLNKYNIEYSKIYSMGEERTGCMFCMFGVHMEGENNRFIRMKSTHPEQYKFCIEKLGCGQILDYIDVPY